MLEEDEKSLNNIRVSIVDVGFQCGQSAHFGGGLSIVELLYVLYRDVLNVSPESRHDADRDIFVLSKGHGVLGLYGVLHFFGFIPDHVFRSFQQNGSPLIAHPVRNFELGIESSNGSLGQGLSYIAGMALASRLKGENRAFFTLMGDGECNEGSVWEAAMFCAQYKLGNLVAIVDNNGFQNDDATENVSAQNSVGDRWRAFGWRVFEIDGHHLSEIRHAFEKSKTYAEGPCVVIANTIKGKGVSFMENDNDWHHNRLTSKTHEQAMSELVNGD